MRRQEATTTVRAPLDVVERYVADVEQWPTFLIGLESVVRLSDDTYRFHLRDEGERDTTVEVRHQPLLHKVSWHSIEGPAYTGIIELKSVDEAHTRVRLDLASHPGTLMSGFAEMLFPRMDRAAGDLRELSEHLPGRTSEAGRSPTGTEPT